MSSSEPIFDYPETRSFTFEALERMLTGKATTGGATQLGILFLEIQAIAALKGRIQMPNGEIRMTRFKNNTNEKRVLAVVSNLFNEGILAWGLNLHSERESPWFPITEYGESVLKGDPNPHDPDGYLKQFNEKVLNADPLVLIYLQESLQCFRNNNLLASSIMLGVASEATFDKFFDTLTICNRSRPRQIG